MAYFGIDTSMHTPPPVTNLLRSEHSTEEVFHELLKARSATLEHIVSHGQSSPAGFWYDQEQDEWVMLLQGEATLEFESSDLPLTRGDALTIPGPPQASSSVLFARCHLARTTLQSLNQQKPP